MQVKRYQAQSVREALRAVREDLGPDALVVSTRSVPAPGPRGWLGARLVQVTAADGRTDVPESRQAVPAREARDATAPRPDLRMAHAPVTAPSTAGRAPATGRPARSLIDRLAPLAAGDDGFAPVEVFVGPPGSGKTTTVAKIAAREYARHGHRLGLVAADGYRVGAVEQLRLYAQILGSPLAVARTPYDLQTALETAAVPMLVDTAGRSAGDMATEDVLRLIAAWPGARIHLVVPADAPLATLRAAVARCAPARPSRLVVTRLDDAPSLEPVAALLDEHRLRLSYLGTGQRVPDDLEPATARAVEAWASRAGMDQGAVA